MRKYIVLVFGCLIFNSCAFANSFQLWQQSASQIGDDGAGAAASANDATTAYYNPAGLTRIKHQDMALSLLGTITNIKFKGQSNLTPAITGFTNSGTAQGGDSNFIPTILYAAPLDAQWAFGFSVSSPFNRYINYGQNDFTRYAITESTIKTTDISPSFSYRPFDHFSIGFGADAERVKMEYDRIDTITSTANDAVVTNKLGDWSFGWNTGALWEITQNTRMGISYHAKITHHLSGNSRFYGTGTNGTRVKSDVYLPPLAMLSLYHDFNNDFALMSTVSYTQWEKFGALTLNNVAGQTSPTTITLQDKMKNAWRFVLGAHYHFSQRFQLRGAIGYDQSPTNNKTRDILMPDANQYIVALGLGYTLNKTVNLDLGYSHAFMQHISVNHTQTYGATNITNIGNLQQNTDLIGLQLNWLMT